jgi:hypothetical protein
MGTANERGREVVSLLKEYGVEEKDIQTRRAGVSPIYDREKRTQPPPIVGYHASNDLTALFRGKSIGRIGDFLDKATAAGATNFGGFQYEISTRRELERDALAVAARDARSRADMLAGELGVVVGRVLHISETGMTPAPVLQRHEASVMQYSDSSPAQVMPGEITITAGVDVVFEVKEKE